MKKLVLLSLALMLSLTELFAARMLPTRGRVVDEQGNAVAYATVVLLRDEKQVAGMASDEEGRFELRSRRASTTSASSMSATNPSTATCSSPPTANWAT